MSKTAIIGFGGGGYHAAKALREADPYAAIDVYTETDNGPANPMLTTYYVAGKIERNTQMPYGAADEIAARLHLNVYTHERVKHLQARKRTIELANGTQRTYDNIILATGSHPLIPPIQGLEANRSRVFVMRTVADADRLLQAIKSGLGSALVIGASWVGIKAVEALYAHHVSTVMADMAPHIFPAAALPDVAEVIHQHLQELGISLKFGAGITSLRRDGNQVITSFSDGSEVHSDIVILSMGLRPTVDIADPSEIDIGRGFRVNARMQTSVPHIYAVGDCCEAYEIITHQPVVVNLWANALVQGSIAGKGVAGIWEEFSGNFIHNITHFLDMDFIGLGDNRALGEHIVYRHQMEGWTFCAIVHNGRISCINVLGNHKISGPAKAALIRSLTTDSPIGPAARLALQHSGLPAHIVAKIGGY